MKRLLFLCLLVGLSIFFTGCTNDSMDNIEIAVTNYPNEYIVKAIYGEHSTITSVYPDGVDIEDYTISKKQKAEYAKKDLFVYNGLLEKERNLALELLSINPELKIIDTAYVLEAEYSPEELWLNPSSLLMMSQNVRTSLNEYISNAYLKKDVNASYDTLKILLSELDAEYRVAADSTNNKNIIVANSALNYLEKFGLHVICVDQDATQKSYSNAENLIQQGSVSYIFAFEGEKVNENVTNLLNQNAGIQLLELHKLDNISDTERSEKKDYQTLILENLELIKKELYQ
ncbi:MAG: zinc ABC transporter substrate-binding protein [Bacilli bacterium]|nr:zinc ABC transporter substrate-binding protein [Bacilli bacterium]